MNVVPSQRSPEYDRPWDTSHILDMIAWHDRMEIAMASRGSWVQAARHANLAHRLENLAVLLLVKTVQQGHRVLVTVDRKLDPR